MNEHIAAAETALRRLARQRAGVTRALVTGVQVSEERFAPMPVIAYDETPSDFERMQLAQRAYSWMAVEVAC